ncbi:hypothetical protein MHZ95_05805 [Sporosarcina sp. ACRSM]|uniref:hypothetical protein n=1 Tax=Sporosarcina sp. ACRSM TaxID=2918216 RepID=UPI001EF51D64|nr:hypothetical protein [Sporosarcina sp. ACRSM]MCG7334783.1 hypothetical protein [Sporosarcina sp. ACRSM]
MDTFILIIDILVALLYIAVIALVSPYMMHFLQKRNCDKFIQLLPVLSLILITSILIANGYGGFQETIFFQLTSIISFILLFSLLFLTLFVKKQWQVTYDQLLTWISFSKFKETIFSKAK